jgi:hypothetical protein
VRSAVDALRWTGILLLGALPVAAACGGGGGSVAADRAPELERLFAVEGLDRPESVAFDGERDRWLIASRGGTGPDGGGYVSAVPAGGGEPEHRVFRRRAPGLTWEGPTGIAVRGRRAYVVDARSVVAVDLDGDTVAFRLRLPGSGPLDDVVADDRGVLYVSDPDADAVYTVAPDGSGWSRVPSVGSLRHPAGLLPGADSGGHHLVIAGREGAVLTLHADSSVTLLAESAGLGRLDGIQRSPGGHLLVSDHAGGRLQLLQRRRRDVWRAGVVWIRGLEGPADFSVLGDTLAVPEAGAGRVTFFRIRG